MTEALTQEAIKRLEAIRTNPREAGKPFYLYMAHYALHSPLDERAYDKRFADAYKNPEDGHKWSRTEKHYSGLIEGMDKSLGDIMKYLREHHLEKIPYWCLCRITEAWPSPADWAMKRPITLFPSARGRAWKAVSGSL